MAKVYICLRDCVSDYQTPDAWMTTTIMNVFASEESAKNWIDEQRLAHLHGNDGAANEEDISEQWSKGENYKREFIKRGQFMGLSGISMLTKFYYQEKELED